MANPGMLAKAVVSFFSGVFIMIVTWYVVPVFIEVGQSLYPSDAIQTIGWGATVGVWILTIVIVPVYFVMRALNDNTSGGDEE